MAADPGHVAAMTCPQANPVIFPIGDEVIAPPGSASVFLTVKPADPSGTPSPSPNVRPLWTKYADRFTK